MATTATMTGAQFDALPYEEGRRWELIAGELVEVSSPTPQHQKIVSRINRALEDYFAPRKGSGDAFIDVEFALTTEDRVRPEVLVLLADKLRSLDFSRVPIPDAPDIAIEIISPSERAADVHAKLRRYLETGTLEVWQVYPKSQTVVISTPSATRTAGPDAEIITDLLPRLTIPVAAIFDL